MLSGLSVHEREECEVFISNEAKGVFVRINTLHWNIRVIGRNGARIAIHRDKRNPLTGSLGSLVKETVWLCAVCKSKVQGLGGSINNLLSCFYCVVGHVCGYIYHPSTGTRPPTWLLQDGPRGILTLAALCPIARYSHVLRRSIVRTEINGMLPGSRDEQCIGWMVIWSFYRVC